MIKSTDYRHRGHRAIYQDRPKVTWIHPTFHSPPLDNLYRPVKVRTRLWEIAVMAYTLGRYCGTAGRAGPGRVGPSRSWPRAGPGRAAKWPGICGPGRAENFRPVHISSTNATKFINIHAAASRICCRMYTVCLSCGDECSCLPWFSVSVSLSVTARISQDYELSVFVRHLIRHKLNKALQITRHNMRLPVFYTSYSETE